MSDESLMTLADVRYGFRARPDFLGPIQFHIRRGEVWGIIGPNGAGKSTLLRVMAGLYPPTSGHVVLCGEPLRNHSLVRRAKLMAFVPQYPSYDLQVSAREVVLMGRFPHRRWGMFETAADLGLCERAMALTETTSFAGRSMATLSGGESQRVHVAAALAQDARLLLLDEPTASLDLLHQIGILRVLRDWACRMDRAVVVVMHDVNLAAQFCTHVLLLSDGRAVSQGSPEQVIQPDVLAGVYHLPLTRLMGEGGGCPYWVVPHGDMFKTEIGPMVHDGVGT